MAWLNWVMKRLMRNIGTNYYHFFPFLHKKYSLINFYWSITGKYICKQPDKFFLNGCYSFSTDQRDVTLYLTAVASLSALVQKPTIKVHYFFNICLYKCVTACLTYSWFFIFSLSSRFLQMKDWMLSCLAQEQRANHQLLCLPLWYSWTGDVNFFIYPCETLNFVCDGPTDVLTLLIY